jgi:hypothetical protein
VTASKKSNSTWWDRNGSLVWFAAVTLCVTLIVAVAVSLVAAVYGASTYEWLTLGMSVIATAFVASSVGFLAVQTQGATRQAGFNAFQSATRDVDQVMAILVQYPSLRKYFFEDADPSAAGNEDDLSRIHTVAECLLDGLSGGVDAERFSPRPQEAPFRHYAIDLLSTSRVMREELDAHPTWWPDLRKLVLEVADGGIQPAPPSNEGALRTNSVS